MLNLPAIKKLCEAASEAPWHRNCGTINTRDGWLVASLSIRGPGSNRKADAEFIAQARTLVPQLLDKLEEAQGKLDAVEDYEHWRDSHMAAEPGYIPACLGPDCPSCKQATDALLARILKGE